MPDAVQPVIPDEAVAIIANQLAVWQMDVGNGAFYDPDALLLLERVYPVIEAELREQIASEIEAHAPADRGDSDRAPDYRDGVRSGYLDAADIARRTADVAIGWPLGRDAARVARGEQ